MLSVVCVCMCVYTSIVVYAHFHNVQNGVGTSMSACSCTLCELNIVW